MRMNHGKDGDGEEAKNRGYFSENAIKYGETTEYVPDNLRNVNTAIICPMYSWRVRTEQYSPVLMHLNAAERRERYLEPAQKWIRYPGRMAIAFPVQTINPKVQLVRDITPGQLPREVEVDRRRRNYAKINISDLLTEAGIDSYRLIPDHVLEKRSSSIFNRLCLFPLEWFDNSDFDPMTPNEWLNLGYIDGVKHPIPAEAFLPNRFLQDNPRRKSISVALLNGEGSQKNISQVATQDHTKIRNHLYTWTKVAVKAYDPVNDKWIVTDLITMKNYKIPRIYLMFTAENPHDFVKRIQYAVDLREKSEKILKFEVIVDCLQLAGLPKLPNTMLDRMFKLAKSSVKDSNKEWLDDLEEQINLLYQRAFAAIDFKDNIAKNPEQFPFVQVPENRCMIQPQLANNSIGAEKFKTLRQLLNQNTFYYVQQSIAAMYKVASECEMIDKQSLFMLSTGKTTTLKDFVSTQQYTCNTVTKYLKGFWLENMTGQICMRLRGVGKGWLDLTINDWSVYKVSKINRFLRQVKYRMQDALHCFLERSILGYSRFLCDPCEPIANIPKEFSWTGPFNTSPFISRSSHIFYLTISMTENGARFSTEPEDFRPAIIETLDDALLQCCGIYQIDPNVMSSLVFRNDLHLQSIVLVEDLIEDHRKKLIEMYDKAIIPLKAYAEKFNEFIPLFTMNVNDFVQQFFGTEKSPYEVKEEILLQMRMRDRLEDDLPKKIVIGPFLINVEPLKIFLITKRKDIIKKHLDAYTSKLRKKTESLLDEFQQIMVKIAEKPNSIEHFYEIRDYIGTIPDYLTELGEVLRLLLLEYDILDIFWHSLSNEDFSLKWDAIAWPHKITQHIEKLKDDEEQEIEEFKKLQISDLMNYSDRVESLNEEILKYSRYFDQTKALENAADIKKTWKIIEELRKQGVVLQERQILFGMSAINFDMLNEIVKNIERYKNLWYACADYLKHEDIAYGNPLNNLDVVELRTTIENIQDSLKQSFEFFNDKPEIIAVAQHYAEQIEQFEPSLIVLECVRSPHWSIIHWQELAKRAEIDVKFSLSINFRYCINKGILDHVALVEEIWERGKTEADLVAKMIAEEEMRQQEANKALLERKKNRKGRTDI